MHPGLAMSLVALRASFRTIMEESNAQEAPARDVDSRGRYCAFMRTTAVFCRGFPIGCKKSHSKWGERSWFDRFGRSRTTAARQFLNGSAAC